jgi:hypothetical protein
MRYLIKCKWVSSWLAYQVLNCFTNTPYDSSVAHPTLPLVGWTFNSSYYHNVSALVDTCGSTTGTTFTTYLCNFTRQVLCELGKLVFSERIGHIYCLFLETTYARFSCDVSSETLEPMGVIKAFASNVVASIIDCSRVCLLTPVCVDFGWIEATHVCMLYSTDRVSVHSQSIVTVNGAQWCKRILMF